MKRLIKIGLVATAVYTALEIFKGFKDYYKEEAEKAYRKGRTDCVDDFVRGFAFANGKTITIESEHNGSITVEVIR